MNTLFYLFYAFIIIYAAFASIYQLKNIAKKSNHVIKTHNHAKYKKTDRGHQPRASQPLSQNREKRKHNPVAISKGLPAG